ncbi:MAG: poly(A)-specific ribonuclease [Caeruleum heppii]|nr:MAG: poly(A)-specific ribonuclease [Caeruleum heppii]
MFIIDVDKGQIVKEVPTENGYTLMRLSRYICAATSSGSVELLEPTSFKVVKTWKAHAAAINDMDAQNNFLVTCGYSLRQQQSYMLDPLANVFDLKNLIPLPPIPFHAGAAYVRMHPRMSTTGIVASQSGQMQVVDLMNPNTVNLRQAIVSSYMTNLELAPSGEALALADADCSLQLWGSPSKIRFVDLSNPAEFADAKPAQTQIGWTPETPLSSIGMPYYRERLLSAWTSPLVFEVGAPPPKIDPEILASLTLTDFGGFAQNPGKTRRNQVENTRSPEKASTAVTAPKFLSEKARDAGNNTPDERRGSDQVDGTGSDAFSGELKAEVPVMYRNVEIKYSRFGVDDFDFKYYNKTEYSGLETHIVNSYSNPLLQLYRFTPLLRNVALHHAASSCLNEMCLLCEMGFLFNMLELAAGQNCQATNLLKTFSSMPQSAALGLLEEDASHEPLDTMIQIMNRFMLERVSFDHKQMLPQSRKLDRTLATSGITSIRCVKCLSETIRPGGTFVNDMIYPVRPTVKGQPVGTVPSFPQILKASLEQEKQTRGWCDRCRRYQSLTTRKTIQTAPDVLMLNAALNGPETKHYWSLPGWLPDEIGLIVDSGQVFCYEGDDLQLHLQRAIQEITRYELVGVVADIASGEHQASHLVSIINVGLSTRKESTETNWHLFNDFLVKKITKEEAFRFNPSWKMPSVLAYQAKTEGPTIDDSWKDHLDTSLLFHEYSINQCQKTRPYRLLSSDTEAPAAGMHVAIDAEFVALQQEEIEIKADGSRETIRPSRLGLARVSVLRGSGEDEGLPFIDDYITTSEPIVDYLTAFSGIRAGDLSPQHSPHNLVPLKVAYKKLWLLLNLGCIFIGHGLPKDFRTINMHVPRAQVIDTVDLFFIRARQRRLSLRFLAWILLRQEIQTDTHDSIEDARTALALWRKYLEFQDAGVFERVLADVYQKGRECGYKAPNSGPPKSGEMLAPPGGAMGGGGSGTNTPGSITPGGGGGGAGSGTEGPSTPVRAPAVLSTVSGSGSAGATSAWTPGKGNYFGSPLR